MMVLKKIKAMVKLIQLAAIATKQRAVTVVDASRRIIIEFDAWKVLRPLAMSTR